MGDAATLVYAPFGVVAAAPEVNGRASRGRFIGPASSSSVWIVDTETGALNLYDPPAELITLPPKDADSATNEYGDVVVDKRFSEHFLKLEAIRTNAALIPDGADAPSSLALRMTRAVLNAFQLEGEQPARVVASAEGGVAICFIRGDKYSDIECLNDGTILAVTSNRRERPVAWEVAADHAGISGACARIRKFLRP